MSALDIEERITFESLSPYFPSLRRWSIVTAIVPLTVVIVLWPRNEATLLVGWLLAALAGIYAKYLLSRHYQLHASRDKSASKWHVGLLLSTAFMGSLWVIATFAFFDEHSAPHQVFMITVAVTLGIGSITSGTHWLPLYYVYGVPILIALILRLAFVGSLPYLALACLMVLALLTAINIAKQLNATVRSEMRLHYSSADLARELQHKTREAQEAVFAKSRILATASHDLRQPLHAISLYIDALRDTPKHNRQEGTRIFRRLDTCLGILRKQFDGILDISRLDANAVQPEPYHFDIAECLEGLEREYREEARNRHLSLRMHSSRTVVNSDRALLERILRNLITNALRYTNTGGVLIASRRRKDHVLIQVIDTGSGIPPDKQETAFIEFQQLDNAGQEQEKGLGFGLAIVRRLCELLGLPLSLRSRVGYGSTFEIRCPLGSEAQAENHVKHDANHPHAHDRQKLVLVIDDDPSVLDAMHTLLSRWGLTVIVAESLVDMLQKMPESQTAPDLILTDLSLLKGPDGIGIISQLRDHFRTNIPGVLISGTTDPDKLKQARSSGYRLVQKPINPSELRSLVQHQLYAHN